MKDNDLYETTIPGKPGRVTRGGVDITDKMVSATGRTLEPGTYTVGVCKVEQVCGRIERTLDMDTAVEVMAKEAAAERQVPVDVLLGRTQGGNTADGKAFLTNRARQMEIRDYQLPAIEDAAVRADARLEYAFGKSGDDPRDLEFKPLGICKLEIISWDEAVPCGDDAVSQGMLTRWLPLHNPAAPSKAFPHGFADTIYFPMRKGIRKIVIRRKAK